MRFLPKHAKAYLSNSVMDQESFKRYENDVVDLVN